MRLMFNSAVIIFQYLNLKKNYVIIIVEIVSAPTRYLSIFSMCQLRTRVSMVKM